MLLNFKVYLERWRSSKNRKHDLDVIIDRARPNENLYNRLVWLVDLIQWIRFAAIVKDHKEVQNVKVPAARIRFFLNLLDRNPDWKLRVAQTLRSIVRDIRAADLFCEIGLPHEDGFWTELIDRIFIKLLPEKPPHEGMTYLFNAMFPEEEDVEWMSSIDVALFSRLLELFTYQVSEKEHGWNKLALDVQDAILILSAELEGIGLSYNLRSRMMYQHLHDLPFVHLQAWVEQVIETANSGDSAKRNAAILKFQNCSRQCAEYFDEVFRHLDQFGINQKVVFLLESGHAKLRRLEDLMSFLRTEAIDPEGVLYFLIQLVSENQERQSLSGLFEQNTRLIARKIVDRSAEVGEHYITRTPQEYKKMFRRAAGGGWITAFTVYIKTFTTSLGLANFFDGLFLSINYGLSFVAIQLSGFTLATKQPAMTGPALAAKMQHIEDEPALNKLIDEIIHLVRTQSACILGNVGLVVPTILIIEAIAYLTIGANSLSTDKALKIVNSTNIFGPTILYATFTGVLLWISSLAAGWFDNWFVLNHMRATISFNRNFIFVFGQQRCQAFATYLEKNISGFAGNISLGFLLGLTPAFFNFFGIGMDVRHVTLASGSLALAVSKIGLSVFQTWDFWLAVVGIIFIGAINVGVSFALAFGVAMRSRNIQDPQRRLIYSAFWARIKENPAQILRP